MDLPITPFKDKIASELARAGELILTAPTGSGKSTQTPRFLLGKTKGRILILEPRRLSARSLAARVASEEKTALGGRVGYQVRFDSKAGPTTEAVFQTYGVFVAQMMKDPVLPGVGAVLLDEFHERALDADLALAWLKSLRKTRPDLKFAAMSATLDAGALGKLLPNAARIDVPGRIHPVDIRHRPTGSRERIEDAALAALKDLAKEGLDGSVLIFMPGAAEIRRTAGALATYAREQDLEVLSLHGSMELDEQQRVMDPGQKRRVIIATNVAETGLTIPGVTAVIDSGLHRVAAHDAARGINTLYLSRIARANADQRAGRAGRTAPGRCIRLWSKADEAGMSPSLKPEISRLELSSLRLQASSLPEAVEWLTPPPGEAWEAAGKSLAALGAIDDKGRATARGRDLLRYPAPPKVAAVLDDARALGPDAYERACAMAAVFETAGEAPNRASDLQELSSALLAGAREELSRETVEAFRQLKRIGDTDDTPRREGSLADLWLSAFTERLAVRDGAGSYYRLADGRGVTLPVEKNPPPLILALEVRERAGGGKARQVTASLYLPLDLGAVERVFPGETDRVKVAEFDDRKGRVVSEERLVFRGLVLERKEAMPERGDKKTASSLWAEKFASGELSHPGMDEKAKQWLTRVAIARRLYPDMGFPKMDADDWRLVYEEVCAGKNSLKDIERVDLLPKLDDYLGPSLASFLNRQLPTSKKLPSGKSGRFTYFENQPAELDARLGDFVGMTGTMSLCEGRLPVIFDVLAPNFRTVQKTADLSSFWKNAYPTIKKELQRRYPRHPWP